MVPLCHLVLGGMGSGNVRFGSVVMGALASYNRDVMAIACPECRALPLSRCHPRQTGTATYAHKERLALAGWKWDYKAKRLEKL